MKLTPVLFASRLAAPAAAETPAPPAPAQTAPAAQPSGQMITMEQAVEIAMQQQPSLRLARAQVELARGRVDQTKTALRPQITVSGGVNVGGGQGSDVRNVSGGLTASASATWRITDFGLTAAQVHAGELNVEAAQAGTQINTFDVRTNVEIAYLEAIARARVLTVAETTVTAEEQHLDQAKRFVAAGAKDPIEVVQAQSRAANAKAARAEAQARAATSLAVLRSTIGWVDPTQTLAVGQNWPSAPPTTSPPALPALVDEARSHRPELVQLDKQLAAAEANIDVAQKSRNPVLSARASANYGPGATYAEDPMTGRFGSNFDVSHPNWTAGLTLSWLIFDGGKQKADIRIARANRESAVAQRDALLLSMTSQLDATRATIESARESIVASTEAVTAARAQLKLAEARYTQGLGSQIELADAQTAVTTAEGNLITAEWGLATAWASPRPQPGAP